MMDNLYTDILGEILKYLFVNDYFNLLRCSKQYYSLFSGKYHYLSWPFYCLPRLKRFDKQMYDKVRLKIFSISHVRKLEELVNFPHLREIYFHKQFPNNRSTNSKPIRVGFIPEFVKIIHFGGLNHRIIPCSIPTNLVKLYFGKNFNQPIGDGVLNKLHKLEVLQFGKCYSHKLKARYLPPNLEVLIINSNFYSYDINSIMKKYHNTLKVLQLSDNYNTELEVLPESLERLILGNSYNHNLMHLITKLPNLKYLKVGKDYKHYLNPELLPKNLILSLDINAYKDVVIKHYLGGLIIKNNTKIINNS